MASLVPLPKFYATDNNGRAVPGGKLFTYIAGSSTKLDTYTTSAGNVANTNPVVMDSAGRANVWVDPAYLYKWIFSPSTDTDPPTDPFWTVDSVGLAADGISFIQGGTGAVRRTVQSKLREVVSVTDFGAVADSTTDVIDEINDALTYAKSVNKPLYFPANGGEAYMISESIENITNSTEAGDANGVQIIGDGRGNTVIRATNDFDVSTPLINLDGNPSGNTAAAHYQNFDSVEGVTLDCNDRANSALRLRAVVHGSFEDLEIMNVGGDVTTGGIMFSGALTPEDDDADTTFACVFNNIRIDTSAGFGVLADDNRTATINFSNCDIRNCAYDGMRMAFASLTLDACTFGTNGIPGANTTGGFTAARCATGAVNRGLTITGSCQFENNYNHELNIDWCYGGVIDCPVITPFTRAASGQSAIRIGRGSVGSSEVDGIIIQSPRLGDYSSVGPVIAGFDIGEFARNVDIRNASFQGTAWDSKSKQFTIDASAAGIRADGFDMANYSATPMFQMYVTQSASAIDNVTGDGTAYLTTDVSTSIMATVENTGPQRQRHFIANAQISTTTLTVNTITGTPLQVGNRIIANAGADVSPNTYITALGSGTGGTGTYTVNKSQTVTAQSLAAMDTQWFSVATGRFTAPYTGMHDGGIYWTCTGFSGAETGIEVYLLVNPSGSALANLVYKATPDAALGSGSINRYGGTATVFLTAGDVVVGALKISGGTKVVDIYRDIAAPGGVSFWMKSR